MKCVLLDTEHSFMFPINWSNYIEVTDVSVEIVQRFYIAYCTPTSFFVEKDFDSFDPKIHGTCIYLQSFIWPLSFINSGSRSIIHLKCFETVSQK